MRRDRRECPWPTDPNRPAQVLPEVGRQFIQRILRICGSLRHQTFSGTTAARYAVGARKRSPRRSQVILLMASASAEVLACV